MSDIFLDLNIRAPVPAVYDGLSTPAGFDAWWTRTCSGQPRLDAEYGLDFGPAHAWKAKVTRCEPGREFELEFTAADAEWMGTRVGSAVTAAAPGMTLVRFHHTGWAAANPGWRFSCYCWAVYLRLLRRNLEHGELVPFALRLQA